MSHPEVWDELRHAQLMKEAEGMSREQLLAVVQRLSREALVDAPSRKRTSMALMTDMALKPVDILGITRELRQELGLPCDCSAPEAA